MCYNKKDKWSKCKIGYQYYKNKWRLKMNS